MDKLMLLGDTHGNKDFILRHVIPAAKQNNVRWIYQLGDFGYWEHTDEGNLFLNAINQALVSNGLEIVFIQGNHDKVSLIPQRYQMIDGFYKVRSSIWYAPNGTQWDFGETSFIALGGAYSIDKNERLIEEDALAKRLLVSRHSNRHDYSLEYLLANIREETQGKYWFPEEEMSDQELEKILADVTGKVDVILAHDKPLASNPGIQLSPILECVPNQRRLQKAVNALQPKLFVHGHLHIRYTDEIRCGDDNAYTKVEGFGADVPNFNQLTSDWRASDAWEILNLGE